MPITSRDLQFSREILSVVTDCSWELHFWACNGSGRGAFIQSRSTTNLIDFHLWSAWEYWSAYIARFFLMRLKKLRSFCATDCSSNSAANLKAQNAAPKPRTSIIFCRSDSVQILLESNSCFLIELSLTAIPFCIGGVWDKHKISASKEIISICKTWTILCGDWMADEYEKQAERTDYYVAQKKQFFVVIPRVVNMRSREKTIPRRTRGLRRRPSRLNVSPAASSLFKPLLAIPAANSFFFFSRVSRNSTTEKSSTNLDKWILTPHSKGGMHVETGPLACTSTKLSKHLLP